MNIGSSYFDEVDNNEEFEIKRLAWRSSLADDDELYSSAVKLQEQFGSHNYTYQFSWMGIPIIKLPDDVMVLQEFYHDYRPTAVVEIGVARGGGIALAHSLMFLNELPVNILGIDLKIFPHTITALSNLLKNGVELFESDSTSNESIAKITQHIKGHERILVTLDSDHTHAHVLKELKSISDLLPTGSVICVADTVVEDLSFSNPNRSWGKGNNPATAVKEFLNQNSNWTTYGEYSRRAIVSESRDGWLIKVKS